VLRPDGQACLLIHNEEWAGVWQFDGKKWVITSELLAGLELDGQPVLTSHGGRDTGVRLRDLDKDGRCKLIVSNDQQQAMFAWQLPSPKRQRGGSWTKLPFALPSAARIVDEDGKDNGVRFVDIDEDGYEDVIWSNENGYSLHLFSSMQTGWGKEVMKGNLGQKADSMPMIIRRATNNGAWFHSRHLWVQNENTALLKDHVDRRSFNQLLEKVEPTAKSAEASLHSWRARPGFQVELMAAEPLVQSPIAFAWGPDGKFWVVEMGDYPTGVDGKGKPGGRIKFLEDTKGTGRYDKATVFLDNLSFPTSVMPWRKGVIVTCAPDIFYAEDTDGDGKADLRIPLFTGFTEGNPQHRANSLVWGLDNWIYGANGDSGGAVKSVKTGKAVSVSGRDYRFRPDDGSFEAETGQTQYGRCRDDWGNWFGCNNSDPMYHFVLADHYLKRNPHLPSPSPRVQVSVTPGAAPVFPVSRTLPRFNDPWAANRFTSACSVIVYRDELFGSAFANNSFVSEPVHNLVHREIMSPKGVTFTGRRAVDEQQSEFLASSDNWTRPTTIQTGPDGALWVADMYRQVIEHPEWIPEEWQKRLDLRAGHDKGRIYRVYPVGKKPRPIPRLDRLSTAELVAALDNSNGWQRDLAQQLLIQRHDAEAVPLLEKQATENERALCRVHALCTLDGLDALRPAVLEKALTDIHPGIRRHAVRLCEARLKKFPELGAALVKLVEGADSQVRLQLANSLGEWNDPRAGQALGRLALKDGSDPYLLAAVMSSVNEKNLDQVIPTLGSKNKDLAVPKALTENLLRMAIALGRRRSLATLLNEISQVEDGKHASWQFASLAGVLDALDLLNSSLPKLAEEGDADLKRAIQNLDGLFAAARTLIADPKTRPGEQLQAIRLLGREPEHRRKDIDQLAGLLSPQTGDDLQNAAVAALGQIPDPTIPEVLLKGWKGYSPGLRGLALDVLSRREEWVKGVLDTIEKKHILAFEVDAPRRQKLLQHRSVKVRERAAQLLAAAVNADRQKVVAAYRPALALKGDSVKGKEVFKKNCATCHRHEGMGQQVGPDIASVGDKSPESLLIAILDPNRAVEARYISYLATMKNGVTYTGVLTSETGSSITLIGTEGKPQTILRKDLDELTSTGKSLMPEGLEKEIQTQDLADLIAFLRAGVPEPKRKTVEGNHPEVVSALGDGTLRLYPSNCEIYGAEITLEKQNANLGFWTSPEDRAVWTVVISKPGKFAVWLSWACADDSAGNSFLLQIGESRLSGPVTSTGTWDNYQRAKIGEVTLDAGKYQVALRSAGKIKGALLDLKEVRLTPISK
jgi:putative membrane-bound dehydrogenase-like protein